jgi:NADH-quinone oxidoreductase subunit E
MSMMTHVTAEDAEKLETIRSRLTEDRKSRGFLIPILQDIQKEMGYLPAEALDLVAGHLDIPAGEVFGVASFYNQFRFNPPGRNQIKICLGTACHVRGGDIILDNFERKLNIKEGDTTADREFSLERVACVGCCALAPVVMMNDKTHGSMSPSKVEGLFTQMEIAKMKSGANQPDDAE